MLGDVTRMLLARRRVRAQAGVCAAAARVSTLASADRLRVTGADQCVTLAAEDELSFGRKPMAEPAEDGGRDVGAEFLRVWFGGNAA